MIVLILLSSLSFTGSLSDTESKIIEKTEAPANTPAAPAQRTPAPASHQQNNIFEINIQMPACQSWHFF